MRASTPPTPCAAASCPERVARGARGVERIARSVEGPGPAVLRGPETTALSARISCCANSRDRLSPHRTDDPSGNAAHDLHRHPGAHHPPRLRAHGEHDPPGELRPRAAAGGPEGGRSPGELRELDAHPGGLAPGRARAPGLRLLQAPRLPRGPRAAPPAGALQARRQGGRLCADPGRRLVHPGGVGGGHGNPAGLPDPRGTPRLPELPRRQRRRPLALPAERHGRHPSGLLGLPGPGPQVRGGPRLGGAGGPALLVPDRRLRVPGGLPARGHARPGGAPAGQRDLDHRLQPPEPGRHAHPQRARPRGHGLRPDRAHGPRQRLEGDPAAPRQPARGGLRAAGRGLPAGRALGGHLRLRVSDARAQARPPAHPRAVARALPGNERAARRPQRSGGHRRDDGPGRSRLRQGGRGPEGVEGGPGRALRAHRPHPQGLEHGVRRPPGQPLDPARQGGGRGPARGRGPLPGAPLRLLRRGQRRGPLPGRSPRPLPGRLGGALRAA